MPDTPKGKRRAVTNIDTGESYESVREAGEALDKDKWKTKSALIVKVCQGKRKSAYGSHWKYVDDIKKDTTPKSTSRKSVGKKEKGTPSMVESKGNVKKSNSSSTKKNKTNNRRTPPSSPGVAPKAPPAPNASLGTELSIEQLQVLKNANETELLLNEGRCFYDNYGTRIFDLGNASLLSPALFKRILSSLVRLGYLKLITEKGMTETVRTTKKGLAFAKENDLYFTT